MSIFDAVKELQNAEIIAAACVQPTRQRYKYICPLCGSGTGKNHSAALSLNPRTGIFRCFACDFSGDAIELLKTVRNCSTAAAIYECKDRIWYLDAEPSKPACSAVGVGRGRADGRSAAFPERTKEQGRRMIYACRQAGQRDPEFQTYLKKRGITAQTAERFKLGLHTWTQADGRRLKYLLIPYSYTYFNKRLITDAADMPKYQKDKGPAPLLFYATQQPLPADAVLFVCEGELDAIILAQAGFSAVGLGSACNVQNVLKVLPRPFVGEIVICLDADETGRRKAGELSCLLSSAGIKHSKAALPVGCKDIGEIAEKAAAENRDPILAVRGALSYNSGANKKTACKAERGFL